MKTKSNANKKSVKKKKKINSKNVGPIAANILPYKSKYPVIGQHCFLAPTATVIGDVTLGDHVTFWFNTVARGDVHKISIGSETNIQDGSVLHVTHQRASLTIDERVTVGHSVTLHGCHIQHTCLIGMRAVVLDHAVIGHESLIGAGALVTQGQIIPPRSLVLGAPAKVVRELTESEVQFLYQSARNYVGYAKSYVEGDPEVYRYAAPSTLENHL